VNTIRIQRERALIAFDVKAAGAQEVILMPCFGRCIIVGIVHHTKKIRLTRG
jgi:hypothetical protein